MTTHQKFGAWKPVEIFDSIEFFYNVKFTISNVTSERNSQKRKSSKEIICPEMKFPCIVENIQTSPQINTRWHKMAPLLVRRVKQFRPTRLISVIDIWIVEQFNKHLPYVKQLQCLHKNVSDVRDLIGAFAWYIPRTNLNLFDTVNHY